MHSLLFQVSSTVMSDVEHSISVLRSLRRLGVRISLDDYGAGHSSLALLGELPLDEVKLDKRFGLRASQDARATAIIRSTIDLVHDLGLPLVAEGVEDQETLDLLADHGCDIAQGYHLCRPVPPADVQRWFLRSRDTVSQAV